MTGPSRRDRFKPFELVGFAALLGVFAAVVAFAATRDGQLAVIFAGIAFIVGLLVLAMLALAASGAVEPHEDGESVQDRNDRRREQRRRKRE